SAIRSSTCPRVRAIVLPSVRVRVGMTSDRQARRALLLATAFAAVLVGCGPPPPYVRYDGGHYGRAPKPVDDMDVLRAGPPSTRYHDLGTVIVTCPSQTTMMPGPFC